MFNYREALRVAIRSPEGSIQHSLPLPSLSISKSIFIQKPRYCLKLQTTIRHADAEKYSTVLTFCKADLQLSIHLLRCKNSQAPQFPPDYPSGQLYP